MKSKMPVRYDTTLGFRRKHAALPLPPSLSAVPMKWSQVQQWHDSTCLGGIFCTSQNIHNFCSAQTQFNLLISGILHTTRKRCNLSPLNLFRKLGVADCKSDSSAASGEPPNQGAAGDVHTLGFNWRQFSTLPPDSSFQFAAQHQFTAYSCRYKH